MEFVQQAIPRCGLVLSQEEQVAPQTVLTFCHNVPGQIHGTRLLRSKHKGPCQLTPKSDSGQECVCDRRCSVSRPCLTRAKLALRGSWRTTDTIHTLVPCSILQVVAFAKLWAALAWELVLVQVLAPCTVVHRPDSCCVIGSGADCAICASFVKRRK